MSLLLPDIASVGLFPGQCWLRPCAKSDMLLLGDGGPGGPGEPGDLLSRLAILLEEHGDALPKGRRVSVTVSDRIAPLAVLPWQETLREEVEMLAYAQAHFEKQGLPIGDSHVAQVDFRHFGGMGIAFGVERRWIEELTNLLQARELRLQRLAPVSALAYWKQVLPRHGGRQLSLQSESGRHTGLMFDRNGLIGMDVEPVTTSSTDSGTRLLRRMQAGYDDIAAICHWTAAAPADQQENEYLKRCLPDAALHPVHQDCWG